jgi:hypothetical protein
LDTMMMEHKITFANNATIVASIVF